MARIAIIHKEDRKLILYRDDNGFYLQVTPMGYKNATEHRRVTIGEAKQFYDRADEKAEKFAAVPIERTFVSIQGISGRKLFSEFETEKSLLLRKQCELQPV